MPSRRTIVLFCLKRSGTTAIYRAFRDHPGVGVPHTNQTLDLWEPNFWNYAQQAIAGDLSPFRERWRAACPFLGDCEPRSEAEVFAMWDAIADRLGPVLFDKTPSLILPGRGLDLLLRYRELGRDVRFLAVVRDPRDVIASQFELWGHLDPADTPQRREAAWVEGYRHLEALRRRLDIKLIRYEDLAAHPDQVMPGVFAHCDLDDCPEAYAHMRPVHVGRHRDSRALTGWTPGEAMQRLMALYGYAQTPVGVT